MSASAHDPHVEDNFGASAQFWEDDHLASQKFADTVRYAKTYTTYLVIFKIFIQIVINWVEFIDFVLLHAWATVDHLNPQHVILLLLKYVLAWRGWLTLFDACSNFDHGMFMRKLDCVL